MARFFVPPEIFPNIVGRDAHQIRNVLRLKEGELIELFDGSGQVFTAKITSLEKEKISCEILETKESSNEPRFKITLAQALPKGQKMDLIIEKTIELGISRIIPLITERSIAKSTTKLARWQIIAKEAAEQSGRAIVPEIHPVTHFKDVIKSCGSYALALLAYEGEKEHHLKQALKAFSNTNQFPNPPISQSPNLLILIGPEGGFSADEIAAAKKVNATIISLGKRTLRTETAGIALLSSLLYELE